MELLRGLIATTVGYGHFHSMLATFLYMFRIEFANQIAANGVGLAEQSVFPVYRSAVAVYSRLLVLTLKTMRPVAPTAEG